MRGTSTSTSQSTRRPLSPVAACLLVCVVAALVIFLLPLAVPSAKPNAVSASFVAGFNNRAAILATAGVSLFVLLWSMRRTAYGPASAGTADLSADKLSRPLIAAVLVANALISGTAGWLVAQSHLRYLADMGYFLEQMTSAGDYGRHLYTELEFAYGPLLFYPTLWLHALSHASWLGSYIAALILDQSIGLLLLAYILNTLPMHGTDRRHGFLLLAFGAITPLLGLNYTLLRFLPPMAALLYAGRTGSRRRSVLILSAASLVITGISPETALAFLAGCLAFAAVRTWQQGPIRPPKSLPGWLPGRPPRWLSGWLLAAAAPALVVATALLTAGRPYLRMLSTFSRGALQLPVAPYPHLLVFLFATVWLVPWLLGSDLLRKREPLAGELAGCFVLGLAFLPPALGRCDALHVFFNGAVLLILSLVAIRRQSRRRRTVWLVAFAILVGWEQWVNNTLYLDRTAATLRLALVGRLPSRAQQSVLAALSHIDHDLADQLRPNPLSDSAGRGEDIDIAQMEKQVGKAKVATPVEIPLSLEDALKRTNHYSTSFYSFGVDVMNPDAEKRKIDELNQAAWALIPADYEGPFLETPQNIDGVQGFTFPYPQRHPIPLELGKAFDDNLDTHWTDAGHYGPYILYRNVSPPQLR